MKFILISSVLFALLVLGSTHVKHEKIRIEAYTESLCMDCMNFIKSSLAEAIRTPGFFDMADVIVYPYGNAYQKQAIGEWIFTCQHGEIECYGNTVENCAKKYYDMPDFLHWLVCIEGDIQSTGSWDQSGKYCSKKFGLDYRPVQKCASRSEGNALVHKSGVQTEQLDPPHGYTPWIMLNGTHDVAAENSILDSMLEHVCNTYKGKLSPACAKVKVINSDEVLLSKVSLNYLHAG